MAGLFGFMDFTKPGPGVDKNGMQKKPFFLFWEIYFRKFWRLAVANLLFLLCCIPVIPCGLGHAGLTFVTRNYAREKHVFLPSDFWDTIKKNWKQALPVGFFNLFILIVLGYDLYFFSQLKGVWGTAGVAITACVYIVFTFMKYYLYMMMITFKLSIKQLYKNSVILAAAGIKQNLLISLILLACYGIGFLCWFLGTFGWIVLILLLLFVFPAFRSFLIQFTIFPVIKRLMIDPYYKDHPGEDREAKRALNLDDEEEPQEDEAVFRDTGHTDREESLPEPKSCFPRQYSPQELHRSSRQADDDDQTI